MLVNTKSWFRFFPVESTDKGYLSLTRIGYYHDDGKHFHLFTSRAGNHINNSHRLRRPSLFSFLLSFSYSAVWSNSPHYQHHSVLSSTSIPETTPVTHARGHFPTFTFMFLSFSCPNSLAVTPLLLWIQYYIYYIKYYMQPCAPLLWQKHSTPLLSVLSLIRKQPSFKSPFSKCYP